jgi:membrane-associated phospholipid phosphatase
VFSSVSKLQRYLLLAVTFLALLGLPLIFKGLQPAFKILMGLWILLAAALLGRLKLLLRDWSVFVAFIYLFDVLRGTAYVLTCRFGLPVHALYVLRFETALFGGVPSVFLQRWLLHSSPEGPFTWVEKALTFFYASHFLAFLLVGLFIWVANPAAFKRFRASFYVLIGVGVFIYGLVPTVAPWMASAQFGLLPRLVRFNGIILNSAIPTLTSGFDLNPVSAMPSLHAGFPILCCLVLWSFCRWKALPFYLYTLVVLFTIVYTGDHYVTDVLAGLVLAVTGYALARATQARRPQAAVLAVEPGWVGLRKPLTLGAMLLLLTLAVGRANEALVPSGIDLRDPNVPRYADFFKDEGRYEGSLAVQLYFGGHALAWKDYGTALRHFEKSLGLVTSVEERRGILAKIEACRRALGPGS